MNNGNIENTLNRFKENFQAMTVAEDFESRVFAKIKRKKIQRKITASVTIAVVLCAFLFIVQGIVSHKDPGGIPTEQTALTVENPNAMEREETPVMGDVIFSSSGTGTNYAIQQVAYTEENNTF
jgi:hypothetical protein